MEEKSESKSDLKSDLKSGSKGEVKGEAKGEIKYQKDKMTLEERQQAFREMLLDREVSFATPSPFKRKLYLICHILHKFALELYRLFRCQPSVLGTRNCTR